MPKHRGVLEEERDGGTHPISGFAPSATGLTPMVHIPCSKSRCIEIPNYYCKTAGMHWDPIRLAAREPRLWKSVAFQALYMDRVAAAITKARDGGLYLSIAKLVLRAPHLFQQHKDTVDLWAEDAECGFKFLAALNTEKELVAVAPARLANAKRFAEGERQRSLFSIIEFIDLERCQHDYQLHQMMAVEDLGRYESAAIAKRGKAIKRSIARAGLLAVPVGHVMCGCSFYRAETIPSAPIALWHNAPEIPKFSALQKAKGFLLVDAYDEGTAAQILLPSIKLLQRGC